MTQLNLTVALPAGFLSGTYELLPYDAYAVAGAATVTTSFQGIISGAGVLTASDGSAATVIVPPSGGYDAGRGLLRTHFKTTGGLIEGRQMVVPLVETSPGVMDVAYLLSVGRAQVLTAQQAADILELISGMAEAKATTLAAAERAENAANANTDGLTSAIADASAAAGLISWTGGDHTTLPAAAGRYKIMTGVEAGQVWERTTNGANPIRRPEFEIASTSTIAAVRVANVSALRARVNNGAPVQTLGYASPGAGGAAIYDPNPADTTSADNGSTKLVGTDGTRYDLRMGATVDPAQVGADPTGVVDSAPAFNAVLAVGRELRIGNGTYGVLSPLLINQSGAKITGTVAQYGSGISTSRALKIKPLPGFMGEAVVLAAPTDRTQPLRSISIRDVEIDCLSSGGVAGPNVPGLKVLNAYDSVDLSNITIRGVHLDSPGFEMGGYNTQYSQTVTASNVFVIHGQSDNNAPSKRAPAILLYHLNEAVFTNVKGFAAYAGNVPKSTLSSAWRIDGCSGIVFNGCSAAATNGIGYEIVTGRGLTHALTFINPTVELTGKPFNVVSESFQMFGTITTPPAVGAIVQQPADGSTASGTAWVSTTAGVYVNNTTGTFTTGNLYDSAGTLIGTVSGTITKTPVRDIRIINPRYLGAPSIDIATSAFSDLDGFNVEWWDDAQNSVYPLTIASSCSNGNVLATVPGAVTNNSKTTQVDLQGGHTKALYSQVLGNYTLPAPRVGARVTLTCDQNVIWFIGTAAATVDGLTPASGMNICGLYSSATFVGISTTGWALESVKGRVLIQGSGYVGRPQGRVIAETTGPALGLQDGGNHYTNSAATFGLVNTLPQATTDRIGLEYSFTRSGSFFFRPTPNAADIIRHPSGSGGAGKYLELSANQSVTLRCVQVGYWDVVTSNLTPLAYAP